MASLTLTPSTPWQAAQTAAALALPAETSAACANGERTTTADNASSFFMVNLPVAGEHRIAGAYSMPV
jgi:hypothetical protein